MPVPRESGVQLAHAVTRAELSVALVDIVVCDLSRDPRSEDYVSESDVAPGGEGSDENVAPLHSPAHPSLRKSARARRLFLPVDLLPEDLDLERCGS